MLPMLAPPDYLLAAIEHRVRIPNHRKTVLNGTITKVLNVIIHINIKSDIQY